MARNEEKAQAMLNRFVTAKKDANREDKSQRPYLSTECNNVPDCELCVLPPMPADCCGRRSPRSRSRASGL